MAYQKVSILCIATIFIASASAAGLLAAPGYASPYGPSPYAPSPYAPSPYANPYGGVSIASPAITSQQANILRSYGNLGQVSTFSKTIDTPYSSVSKSDVRVSNPGLAVSPYGHAIGPAYGPAYGPALAPAYAPALAPAYRPALAPALVGPRPVAAGLLGVAYSPATSVSHMTYSAPALGLSYAW